jgi:predicted AlkP superfamily pyrophosphatase or phosphodiesterase
MSGRRRLRAAFVAVWLGGTIAVAGVRAAEAQVTAAVETVRPGRAHLVAAGTPTTFVLTLRNASAAGRELIVRVDSSVDATAVVRPADERFQPTGAGLSELRLTVAPGASAHVLAWITPNAGLPEGQPGHATVSAWDGTSPLGTFDLGWKISARPKLFYVVIDALGSGYIDLNRVGRKLPALGAAARRPASRRAPPWAQDPLMPRVRGFLGESALFTGARSVLPSTTDPNHMAALTGSWPGTVGIHSVSSYYAGRDSRDRPINLDGSKDLLRTGALGTPIQSVFDVAKSVAAGGTPDAFNMIVTGKSWLGDLVRDDIGTMDIVSSGKAFPSYVPAPPALKLGDPPGDPDAATDREGTNLGPRPILKIYSTQAVAIGQTPDKSPDDLWVAEAAARMIMAEDPDVAHVVLAEVDTVQHVFGSADKPEEWSDNGTPNVLWDDTNIYNPYANRDPILDVVHAADHSFGYILDTLRARGATGRSFVVLMSDHGQLTQMKDALNLPEILAAEGVPGADVERVISSGELASIYLTDPARAAFVEARLEAHEEVNPVTGATVKPFMVVNRAEMDSGLDIASGLSLEDGLSGNRRGELYSEWCIDTPLPPGTERVRWPDLFVFNRDHYQNHLARTDDLDGGLFGVVFNGHHGAPQAGHIVLAMAGPHLRPGRYDVPATLADVLPTLYPLLGLQPPAHVDGKPLSVAVQD